MLLNIHLNPTELKYMLRRTTAAIVNVDYRIGIDKKTIIKYLTLYRVEGKNKLFLAGIGLVK
jgi:hypothetical protein